jgi:hypothetical protein
MGKVFKQGDKDKISILMALGLKMEAIMASVKNRSS